MNRFLILAVSGFFAVASGVYSIQQPTIRPLHNTRSFEDSLLAWAKAARRAGGSLSAKDFYSYLKSQWRRIQANNRSGMAARSFDGFWSEALQAGVFDTTNQGRKDSSR